MRFFKRFLLVSVATLSLGCIAAPVVPPLGLVYTKVDAPLSIGTGEHEPSLKRGESSSRSILFLVATGDASVKAAARAGGITDIKHIDYEYRNVIGIYQRYTTIVYGE